MKRTKIVCTIGPTSESEEILEALIKEGMNVCRLNFSHGSHEEHALRIETIKRVRNRLGTHTAIMLDTKGPEIRIGTFGVDQVEMIQGNTFTLTTRDVVGDQSIVSISYSDLPQDVEIGGRILIDDGLIDLEIIDIVDGTDIVTKVINSGILKDRKGVNVPSVKLNLPAITDKDISDIIFGIENGVDFIAASFIRKASDVMEIRKILEENGGEHVHIISKIESEEGVENLEEIIEISDGIMVARGDLGVEIKTELMPSVQKDIIHRANTAGKPVITATQMLDSMMRNPRPTRAEVTDVANAILDGSDAVMLSGETASGKYPVQAVHTMSNICLTTENSRDFDIMNDPRIYWSEATTTSAISRSTVTIAEQLKVSAIITATSSGATARAISKFRPMINIVAATMSDEVSRKLSLLWGVHAVTTQESETTDEVIDRSVFAALETGIVDEGEMVVLTAGIPVGYGGTTNLIKVHTIGNILARGTGIGKFSVYGDISVGSTKQELEGKFTKGDIIVAKYTDVELLPFIEQSSGIIVEEEGLTSHSAIIALHFGKPCVVGLKDAVNIFKDGDKVTLDPISGLIYEGEAKVL